MAPIKRKAVIDEQPRKKTKAVVTKTAETRPKDGKMVSQSKKSAEADDQDNKQITKSILSQEERSFPRGGGSVLTPLEHKQIKAQAERDVLFELGNQHASRDSLFGDDNTLGVTTAARPAKKRRKTGERNKFGIEKTEPSSGIKIQGLSYKNLVVGASVLGRITAITSKDLALALPNNLTGFVPITNISERLNTRIEEMLVDDDERGGEDDSDFDLKQLFYVGQWLGAVVVSTSSEPLQSEGKSKRHIELSLDPRQVNINLDTYNVVTNSMIQASVRSIEDHGIVMDPGFTDTTVKGFVSKKELGAAFELDSIQEGQVMLCLVTGKGNSSQVLKLSPDATRFSVVNTGNKGAVLVDAPSVDILRPGVTIDILITDLGVRGVIGKALGLIDVTADLLHSNSSPEAELSETYKIGSKAKARIIWSLPTDDGSRRIGISLLDHVLSLLPPPTRLADQASAKTRTTASELDQKLPSSSIVEDAKVIRVLSERGLYLRLPSSTGSAERYLNGFAHISQVSDGHIDSLSVTSGAYKVDSAHRARIISYNPVDNIYYISLKQSTLEQPFLKIEDLTVGEIVKGTVEKFILGGAKGIVGVLVKVAEGITGLVPEMHLSDVQLKQPERRFKEGSSLRARVLSVDLEKRHLRLTCKRTLLDNENESLIWKDYKDLKPGMESKGTIVNLLTHGAAVQFYNNVRAWLPVAEMTETFIDVPEKHFRLGQTVSVRIVSVDADAREMKVSCKLNIEFGPDLYEIWENVTGGNIVSGTVSEKTAESLTIDLESGLRGIVRIGHLIDGSAAKAESALNRIRLGQKMDNVLVLDKLERSRTLLLSNKSSLIEATQSDSLIRSLGDVKAGVKVRGFVRNINPDGIYVEFANATVGLLPKNQLPPELITQPNFDFRKDQSISAWVLRVDLDRERFSLSMRESASHTSDHNGPPKNSVTILEDVQNPADVSIKSMADFTLGKVTVARIAAVKNTQINVRLADNVQGRIDVSEMFDSWEEITNKATPLQRFRQNDLINVKILGIHDTRNHRFLPISHRQGKTPVFELSAKKSRVHNSDEGLLSLNSVKSGSSYLAFVNNHSESCVWVNLSPNVRGRVALMDLSDDVGMLQDVAKSFPTGCALNVTVKSIDLTANRLDLSAKQHTSTKALALADFSSGMVLPALVTKVSERSVTVQLSEHVAGPVMLVELNDDFDQANPAQYNKNDIVRVCILEIDLPNKKIFLSLRPSRVLSSGLPVKDPQITDSTQLKAGEIVRGFVKQIGDKGVFVSLGARVDAFIKVGDLSDQYIKDWHSIVEIDQLVKGRVLSVDASSKHILMSLKASHVDQNYVPPITLTDLRPGMVVTGKVRKVEDFGAFIDIDDTQPRISGLCHRSQIAEKRVEDVRKLYNAGDVVKAKVLTVDVDKRKISLGLKASYFVDEAGAAESSEEEDGDLSSEMGGVVIGNQDADVEIDTDDEGVELRDVKDFTSEPKVVLEKDDVEFDENTNPSASVGLKTSGFDWTGDNFDEAADGAAYESETEMTSTKKRKRNKAEIKVDLTGDLDKYGPRSVSDFERKLLGHPNDSSLWIQYMAFQLELGEVQSARELAERALRTIHIREAEEKANVWIAWLNLEVEYGDDERVDDVFEQACQVQEPLGMHERLASIYIDSGKHDKATSVFERTVANRNFRASPEMWLNYASFLMEILKQPDNARALLSRSLQSVPSNERRLLTAKFAALEFHSTHGDAERGRTIFEGIVSEWPKWSSGWDMWTDLEHSRISHAQTEDAKKEAKEKIRALYERTTAQKMKKRRARFVFKRWLDFEESEGTSQQAERVKALALDYVKNLQAAREEEQDD